MASASWVGTLRFNMVNINVALWKGTEDKSVHLHQVHEADAGRIRYRRYCEQCKTNPDQDAIASGFEAPDGTMLVITKDDLEALPGIPKKTIDVVRFVPVAQVDNRLRAGTYYIEPRGNSAESYVLLRDALAKAKRVAVCKM